MAPPDPLPTYVYKIVPEAPPSPLPASYPLSELDQKDGFVHLSTATQIPTTADLFFASSTRLWVLKIRFADNDTFRGVRTTWEVPGCPHLYGNFGAADVEGAPREFVRAAAADGDGEGKEKKKSWKEAIAEQEGGWLVF
ncbi:hypothetical protein F4775DRAFT_259515 [Biscogniauxia sp. FL1348]|nr:hypothetical protein F4775DRAFT_259515 [Biscogniauxia sp. FL1348]